MIKGYTEDFVSRMKDFAVLGLSPAQVAERLELGGTDRTSFLKDVTNDDHPLSKEFRAAFRHYEENIDAALNTAAIKGDAKALRLNYELQKQDKIDEIKRKLFGI